ncbi:hypothetical protein JVT61DRAFT_15041 [Boletus reticuloceps]|uniref:MACPF domain-containing protein n=1 Tax=Boletus reticuloceps TaxID=495285 RepID=A0A8I2YCG7_9AGAM|nr:hypothetical protein JVT61DRAFT_15041 [Boletus reticuloceps]
MDLPAVDRLGYALNLLDITPFDIGAVDNHVIYARRLLRIDFNNVRDILIDGVTYSVPRDVSVTADNQIVRGEYISYRDGREAASQFGADASFPLRYFAVSGTTSGAYAARKSFLESHQYAFFSYTEGSYGARLRDYAESLVEVPLIAGLQGIPIPFDGSNETTVKKYKDFFSGYGSHIIHNVNYGARYPLIVWASNETPAVNTMFNTNVKAKFNGIPSGGDFDSSVKAQAQYKTFEEYFQFLVTVSGGGDRSKLANTDATYANYQEWIKSIKENSPGLLSFQVIEVWTLMKFSSSIELKNYADPLYDAFMWIVGHPDVYKTAVSLDIQSDWSEFNLLSPSALIMPDPANPYPATNTVASDTRVQWGKEYSHVYEKKTLRFFVINDGSPIDFSISRGSYAGGGIVGKAIVTMDGNNYTNNRITDNKWNTQWFYKAPVSGTPVSRAANPVRASKPFYNWDEVLKDYLDEQETA